MAQARALKCSAARAKTPLDLLKIEEIRGGLLTAAGVSDKAASHLQGSDKSEAINGLIRNFLEPAGGAFVEELVFRFLLIRGDALGGSMRNIGGFMAQCKLVRSVLATLKVSGRRCRYLHSDESGWAEVPDDDADIELHTRGLAWQTGAHPRTLRFNLTVPLFGNNVDLCLFDCKPEDLSKDTYISEDAYVALGELKGGIDPAGADEHWKTARTALGRIRQAFGRCSCKPHTFFIGAAIESRMAEEIWNMLNDGELENAANLTNDDQIASITRWLCSL